MTAGSTHDEPAAPPGDGGLVRLRLDLGYDGTDFSGWAAQPGLRTVEGVLTDAVTRVLGRGVAGDDAGGDGVRGEGAAGGRQRLRLTVAGRTDAGVHAFAQVAHTDVDPGTWAALSAPSPGRPARLPEVAATAMLRALLPGDVVLRRVSPAPAGFDARFSAVSRRYRYRLCDDPATLDPLRRHDTVLHRRPLDVAAMDEAAGSLLGLRDFAAFCRRREGATTVRRLLAYSWRRDEDGVLLADVTADAFCHSMVRSLVGAALAVGEGRRPVGWPAEVLAAGERGVQVMPPHGLCLQHVAYPPDGELAARALQARTVREVGSSSAPVTTKPA